MKFAERILRTFRHQSIDQIVWQPRIMYWFNHTVRPTTNENYNKVKQFMPSEYIGKDIMQVYDDLHASIRYPAESLGLPLFYSQENKDNQITRRGTTLPDGSNLHEIKTPFGTLTEKSRNGYPFEHLVKKAEDLKAMEYIVSQSSYHFNELMYEGAEEALEDYGLPCSYYFRSPYMRCVLEYLGFEKTVIMLRRNPREMENFMKFLDDWDRTQYKNAILPSKLKWLNFGENIDSNLSPPRYFEKYLVPYYEERLKWIHNEGKIAFIHVDGSFKDLIPFLSTMAFDGYEALTPQPQGDVTLDEMRKAFGDTGKILIDGIPATLFLLEFPESRLIETTQKILEDFGPNLILGISDELCTGDGRRLKTVSNLVQKFEPK